MSYNLIFLNNGTYKCFTKDKKVLKDFLKQRKGQKFNVIKIKNKDITNKLKDQIESEELFITYSGIYMSASEEDHMFAGLDVLISDSRYYFEKLLRDLKYIKFDNNEMKKIEIMIKKIIKIFYDLENDENLDFGDIFNMQKLVYLIIK